MIYIVSFLRDSQNFLLFLTCKLRLSERSVKCDSEMDRFDGTENVSCWMCVEYFHFLLKFVVMVIPGYGWWKEKRNIQKFDFYDDSSHLSQSMLNEQYVERLMPQCQNNIADMGYDTVSGLFTFSHKIRNYIKICMTQNSFVFRESIWMWFAFSKLAACSQVVGWLVNTG